MECDSHQIEDNGWRATRNHMRKPSNSSTRGTASSMRSGNPSSDQLFVDSGVTLRQRGTNSILLQDSLASHKENGRINGKRKLGLSRSNIGECSSSVSKNADSSSSDSSRQLPDRRSTRICRSERDDFVLGPVIEVDELQSPERIENSEDRDRQVESDEMLARQLQEELYNETPQVGNIDEVHFSLHLI